MKRDGFELGVEKLRFLVDTMGLPQELKRPVTILNLFTEYHLPIKDTMRSWMKATKTLCCP